MAKAPLEIPFEQKMNSRVLSWIIGFLIFLETFSLAGTVYVQRFIDSWKTQTENVFTIELLPNNDATLGGPQSIEVRQNALLSALKNMPEIEKTEIIPLPNHDAAPQTTLIKVQLHQMKHIDFVLLESDLAHLAGEVRIQDHLSFKTSLIDVASLCFWIALIFSTLIVISTLGTITFVNHSNIALHERFIDILRLIGATDSYIAKQFTKNSTAITYRGALIAIMLSALSYGLYCLSPLHDDSIVSSLKFMDKELIGVIIGTPLFMLLMVYVSSRLAILHALAKQL
jgi:cell division transport system permease protein